LTVKIRSRWMLPTSCVVAVGESLLTFAPLWPGLSGAGIKPVTRCDLPPGPSVPVFYIRMIS
jgi:hypothetical protein